MSETAKWYGNGPKRLVMNDIAWKASGGSTIKCALFTSSYTPNQDTDEYFDDISANEVAATGNYTAGGVAVTLSDPTYDSASNEVRLDCTDAEWTSSTITARYAVLYEDTGVESTSGLLGYVDFGEDKVSSAGTFTVQWDANLSLIHI